MRRCNGFVSSVAIIAAAGIFMAAGGDTLQIKTEDIAGAEKIIGLEFTQVERDSMLQDLIDNLKSYLALREVEIPNSIPPAMEFNPIPVGFKIDKEERNFVASKAQKLERPANLEELAFWPVRDLAELIRAKKSQLDRAHEDVPRSSQEIRSEARVRHNAHRGAGARAREARRRGDSEGQIPRPPARDSVRREGPSRGQGLQNDLGRDAVQGSDDRRGRDGDTEARRRGRRARRQAHDGRARVGGRLVRRHDAQPVEPRAGIERLFGRLGIRDGGGARRLRHRHGDVGLDRLSLDTLRRHGAQTDVRTGEPHGRDGAQLVDGQDRADLPDGRGLRDRVRRDPRRGRDRPDPDRRAVQLRSESRSQEAPNRLSEEALRGGLRQQGQRRRHAREAPRARMRARARSSSPTIRSTRSRSS